MPDYLSPTQNFHMLSLLDLLAARDLYHLHLMDKAHVVATAVGRYLIRKTDPWPPEEPDPSSKQSKRTLKNSEVRDYSWPCILVLVDKWVPKESIGFDREMAPEQMVPKALHMPDGKVVPVCVVEASRDETRREPVNVSDLTFPQRFIGGGFPVLTDVQQEERFASIGCLVTDGHLTYALTNRHVSGETGEAAYSLMGGKKVRIGKSSTKHVTRLPFEKVYSEWPGKNVYVNLDAGLIEIENENIWTAQVYGIGRMGKLVDLSVNNLSLRLIGCPVRAYGCASGMIYGQIDALFYRYKALGGFEYIADFLIGSRGNRPFSTHHGDSGTIWLLETKARPDPLRPIAIQWGGHSFLDAKGKSQYSYALATCLSTVFNQLEVDLIRDWNLELPEYWGAVGHYTIGNKACDAVSNPNLKKLMQKNRTRISFEASQITKKNLQGLSNEPFVPLADVPDLVWKIGHFMRGKTRENPCHFADMDKQRPGDGKTLLDLCEDPANVKVEIWQQYYDDVNDESRGLLPFRVWQIYQEMVQAVIQADVARFVCAAGVLSHYVGDACQPLHISFMYNGDPDDLPNTEGVHSAYETDMLNFHVAELMVGIDERLAQNGQPAMIQGGRNSAIATVNLMRQTFQLVPPVDIIAAFRPLKEKKPKQIADGLWEIFRTQTIDVITEGSRTLAMLWDSAWSEGGGDNTITDLGIVDEDALIALYRDKTFLASTPLDKIGPLLHE